MRDFFSNSDFNSWAVIQEEEKNTFVITHRETVCSPSLKSLPGTLKRASTGTYSGITCAKSLIYVSVCALKRQHPGKHAGRDVNLEGLGFKERQSQTNRQSSHSVRRAFTARGRELWLGFVTTH